MRQLFGRLAYVLCVKLGWLASLLLKEGASGVRVNMRAGYYFNKSYAPEPRVKIDWTDRTGVLMQTYVMRPQEAEILVRELTDVLESIKSEKQ